MRTMVALLTVILLATLAPVHAQTAHVIVIADFPNTSVDSGQIPSSALSEVLQRLLQRQLPGQARVIAGDSVRAAMRARGYTLDDLIYPSRAAEIAQALGADWVVTGRWAQLRIISHGTVEDPATPSLRQGDAFAIADVELRVMEVSTRRRLLEDRFSGRATGGDLGSLYLAATEALRYAAMRIARL